jgi:hypothetical protein
MRSKKEYESLLTEDTLSLVGYAWNKLYKREVIMRSNGKFAAGVSLVEDILFNSHVLAEAEKIVFIDALGTHYIQRHRETLGAKFYQDYYELKIRACRAREYLLEKYGAGENEIKKALSDSYFAAIKSSCRMVCKCITKTKKEKYQYMHSVCRSEQGKRTIQTYHAKGKNLMFKAAMRTGQYWVFEVLYRL